MAKCCGGTGSCACAILGGRNIVVSGTGSPNDPLIVDSDVILAVQDSESFDLGLAGRGTLESPWILTVNWAPTAGIDSIPDVSASTPTNGYVLAWDSSTNRWRPAPATTATAGSVTTDSSLTGDGSIGAPLQVRENTGRYLETTSAGLGMTNLGVNRTVRYFADVESRNGTAVLPEFGTIGMVGTTPGVYEYWDGTAWTPLSMGPSVPRVDNGDTAILAVSGAFGGSPVVLYNKRITNVTTGVDGSFSVIPTEDLTGYAGVLAVTVQPMGGTPWVCMATADVNRIKGVAWNLTGVIRANAVINASVTATLY